MCDNMIIIPPSTQTQDQTHNRGSNLSSCSLVYIETSVTLPDIEVMKNLKSSEPHWYTVILCLFYYAEEMMKVSDSC